MKSLRVALMGCGRIAKRHATVLSGQVEQAQLVAVCDIVPERAREFCKLYNVPCYPDLRALADAEEPDVIAVLTPSGDHARHALLAGSGAPHVIVEKPLALTCNDILDVRDYWLRTGVTFSTVHQNRYNLPVIAARKALNAGRLGKINLATVRVRWCRQPDYYQDWHGTWRYAGGALANQAIHHMDLLLWLCGPIKSVYSIASTTIAGIEVEDTLVSTLKFASGALGTFEVTTSTRPVDLEGSLSILGTTGTIEIGGFACNKMLHFEFEDKLPTDFETATLCENPPDVYGFGHRAWYEDYCQHILAKQEPPITWRDAYHAIEVISAMYESVETGQVMSTHVATPHVRLGK